MITHSELEQKFTSIWPLLDERERRLLAASEAVNLGYGGILAVHLASSPSRKFPAPIHTEYITSHAIQALSM